MACRASQACYGRGDSISQLAHPFQLCRNPKYFCKTRTPGSGLFVPIQERRNPGKNGVIEIRGPYYSIVGKRYLSDVLETMGYHVDGLKFAGGSFTLFPEKELRELIDLAHSHDVYVSTGSFMEHLLTHPNVSTVVDRYL